MRRLTSFSGVESFNSSGWFSFPSFLPFDFHSMVGVKRSGIKSLDLHRLCFLDPFEGTLTSAA